MNVEKYVNEILKKVKCSRAKKTEIKKQLLADMSMHMEHGETIEQIRETMGTPEEIAEEFNQNLSAEEKKAYKRGKNKKIIAAIVAVCCVLIAYAWWLFPKTGELGEKTNVTQEVLEQEIENVIVLLNQNDFEALQKNAMEEMQSVLNQEAMDKALVGEDWGQMQTIGTVYTQEVTQQGKLFVVSQVDVIYDNVDVIYTISFDENLQLAGIYMR